MDNAPARRRAKDAISAGPLRDINSTFDEPLSVFVTAPGMIRSRKKFQRLSHLLIAKSILESLFVAILATGFFYQTFNPYFRGSFDSVDARGAAGWAVNEREPTVRVEVQLYIDGRFAASRPADAHRPDVHAAGRAADEWHGFAFDMPSLAPGDHEARVYAVHQSGGGVRRTLQMIGTPLRFSVTDAGN